VEVPAVALGPAAVVGQVVGQVVTLAVEQVSRYVRPEAAVAVAAEFTFPLALALAVLVFLLIQGHIDRRDPKLRMAPQNVVETFVKFQGEDQL
jgi:tetrahydromethanopterin S-methyltransferase subunit D